MPTASIDRVAAFFFIGLGSGALCISWLPEKLGRKYTLMVTGPILTACHLSLLYWPNITVKMICFGMMGFFYIGKTVCLNLMYELTEKKHRSTICNYFQIYDYSTYGFLTLGIWIVRDWEPLFTVYTYLGVICLTVYLVVMPESPKYLLMRGEKTKAIASLNLMAALNGSTIRFNKTDIFVEEEAAKITAEQEQRQLEQEA